MVSAKEDVILVEVEDEIEDSQVLIEAENVSGGEEIATEEEVQSIEDADGLIDEAVNGESVVDVI